MILRCVTVCVLLMLALGLSEIAVAAANVDDDAVNTKIQYINWTFSVYAEPDFRAERVAGFDPQAVNVIYEGEDGWALISTAYGDSWVHLSANKRFIERRMGLFEHKEDEFHVCVVSPQVVTVLEREGHWLQIETWRGPMWIYLDFVPPTHQLDNLLRRFGDNLSVYFENLETGFVYTFNGDRVYFSASVPKASFALYIYLKAERGETNLDDIHTFTGADYDSGSGIIRHRYATGTTFTHRELLRLNLSYSDNIATRMLVRIHGVEGYRQFVADIGGNPAFVQGLVMNSYLTVNDAGLFAREIFEYIESGGRYSHEFRYHLLNNQSPFIVSDYPVASKTGWSRPRAWHDMAIVYAPSPYVLVILSARDGWSARDFADFAEISMAFQRFNDFWFVPD